MNDLLLLQLPDGTLPVSSKFNDLRIENYDLVTVDGQYRKAQDVVKILVTAQQSNPVYPLYGSTLSSIPGTRKVDEEVTDLVREAVIQCLGFVQAIETSPKTSERVLRIISLQVEDGADPREIIIRLVVELEDGNVIQTLFPIIL